MTVVNVADKESETGGRLMTCFLYLRNCEGDNHYAHPLDLFIHIDMTAKKVLHDRSFMHKEVGLLPEILADFHEGERLTQNSRSSGVSSKLG